MRVSLPLPPTQDSFIGILSKYMLFFLSRHRIGAFCTMNNSLYLNIVKTACDLVRFRLLPLLFTISYQRRAHALSIFDCLSISFQPLDEYCTLFIISFPVKVAIVSTTSMYVLIKRMPITFSSSFYLDRICATMMMQ